MTTDAVAAYAGRGLNPARHAAILAHAGPSVVDVGCGSGAYVLALRDRYDIRGVDHRPYESWREAPDRFSVGDAGATGLPDASADTVLCFETLEHLPDPAAALRDFHRIARRNLILTVPNCELTPGMEASRLIYYHWIDPTHRNFFTPATIAAAVEAAGFRLVANDLVNDIDVWPFVDEAFDLSGVAGRVARRLLVRRLRRTYPLTSLVVAEKVIA